MQRRGWFILIEGIRHDLAGIVAVSRAVDTVGSSYLPEGTSRNSTPRLCEGGLHTRICRSPYRSQIVEYCAHPGNARLFQIRPGHI